MTCTKTKTHNNPIVDEYSDYVDNLSHKVFPKEQWEEVKQLEGFAKHHALYDMQTEVLETAFYKRPDLFENMQWINTEEGLPLWVRPGVDWSPETFD